MVTPKTGPEPTGALAELFQPERRLLARLAAVFRLDPQVYEEIQTDKAAIPQAFALVIATSILTGLGQGSIPGLFLGNRRVHRDLARGHPARLGRQRVLGEPGR